MFRFLLWYLQLNNLGHGFNANTVVLLKVFQVSSSLIYLNASQEIFNVFKLWVSIQWNTWNKRLNRNIFIFLQQISSVDSRQVKSGMKWHIVRGYQRERKMECWWQWTRKKKREREKPIRIVILLQFRFSFPARCDCCME